MQNEKEINSVNQQISAFLVFIFIKKPAHKKQVLNYTLTHEKEILPVT
jgi:hypothetical protein